MSRIPRIYMSPPLPPLPPDGPEYSWPFKCSQRTTPSPPLPPRAKILNSSTRAIKIFKYFYNLKRVEKQKVYGYTERRERQYFKKGFNEKFKNQKSRHHQYKNPPP